MLACTDPTITYLAEYGFNVIRLPRSGLRPADVLVGKGPRLEHLGDMSRVWRSARAVPPPRTPVPATMLKGRSTEAFSANIGISLLTQLLSAVGVSPPKLEAALSSVDNVSFGFGAPVIWGIDILEMGEYLERGKLLDNNPIVEQYFGDNMPPVHLITDLLLSSTMTVEASRRSGGTLGLDLAALQEAVETKVELQRLSEATSIVTFQAEQKLAFGFRAIKLGRREGRWAMEGFARPGSVFQAEPPPPRIWASKFQLGEITIDDIA